jgi:hypothetical protein
MKTKKSLRIKISISVLILVILAAGGIFVYSFLLRPVNAEKTTSMATFNFDDSKAPGWFAGANIDGAVTNASAAPTSKKLADTTRFIAQGTAEKPTGDCFVQYSYWANNSKDPEQVISELVANSDSTTVSSFSLQPTNTVNLKMNTSSGDVSFRLHQYNVVGSDASQMSDGEEFGAFKAGTGYIDIRGYCKTADQLSITLPVLAAVNFKL